MAHLAAFAGLVFLVQVDANPWNGQRAIEMRCVTTPSSFARGGPRVIEPEIAEQVGDGGRLYNRHVPQGKVADGAHQLLELAGDAGAFAGVVAVVRARGEFVDE